jgi:ubiquinone biosynthesis protein
MHRSEPGPQLKRRKVPVNKRYIDILGVAAKYGFGEVFIPRGLRFRLRHVREDEEMGRLSPYRKIRLALEELGPTFIKLGQIVSNRGDMLPPELISELQMLQDRVPPFPFEEVCAIVAEDFGMPLTRIFASFDQEPIAAASIAQVHRAKLMSGETVAVKVQRPGIRPKIEADIRIMYQMARRAEHFFSSARRFRPSGVVREFEEQIRAELDFNNERRNIERFKSFHRDNPALAVPRTYKAQSSRRVLTMEYMDGVKVSLVADGTVKDFDRRLIAKHGAEAILKQLFIDGYFHADPHPGNILILRDGRICFIDFGMMGRLTDRQKELFGSVIMGVITDSPAVITRSLLGLTGTDEERFEELEDEVARLLGKYRDLPIAEIELSQAVRELLSVIIDYEIDIPSNLALVAKTLVIADGLALSLDPDFSIVKEFESFSRALIRNRLKRDRVVKGLYQDYASYRDLLRSVPRDAARILAMMKGNALAFSVRHEGLGYLEETLERISFRLVYGLVLSALLISSSVIVHAGIKPTWNGVSVVGIIGFALGGVMGLVFLLLTLARLVRFMFKHLRRKRKTRRR